jgi:hypothetical protein
MAVFIVIPGEKLLGEGTAVSFTSHHFPESGTWCESSNDSSLRRAEWRKLLPARCFEISPHEGRPGPLSFRGGKSPGTSRTAARRRRKDSGTSLQHAIVAAVSKMQHRHRKGATCHEFKIFDIALL